jgi:hypothetical protein
MNTERLRFIHRLDWRGNIRASYIRDGAERLSMSPDWVTAHEVFITPTSTSIHDAEILPTTPNSDQQVSDS